MELREFGEAVEIGKREVIVIFDSGMSEAKTIRGTNITDTRPFILTTHSPKVGEKMSRGDEDYKIDEVQTNATGFNTCFLRKWDDRGSDYLNKTPDN